MGLHRYTYADYVGLEESSETKHEYFQGEIYAMAGGSEQHSALSAEIVGILRNAARGGPCRPHTSDLRIYVEATGLATFPDAAVIWETRVAIAGGKVTLSSIPAELVVDDVYAGIAI
jgi:Uma2 family endonuclease